MDTKRICPGCQKPLPPDLPLGLCPECLLKAGFNTGTEPGAEGAGFVPPTVEHLAKLFPQLDIIEFIGKGGMGAVYKARQPGLDRFVALKILPPRVASAPGFAERFNREARALARLLHPNIVAVHDFGKSGDLHFLIMEFVDGANLREVERAGRLAPEQALAIVPQICEALQFAHNEGIVHRDIKPENILLDKKGRVKITDFGIAKILGVTAEKGSLTGAKDVIGTPHYMAPEQIEHPALVDHRADIFSLGVVFYEMLTGELPLGKFQPPSKKVQVDVRLDEIVLHALEKEPERRYQHASEVKTEVETITATSAPAAGCSQAAAKTQLNPWQPEISAALALFMIALLIVGTAAAQPFKTMAFVLCPIGVVICLLRLAGLWPFRSPFFPNSNWPCRNLRRHQPPYGSGGGVGLAKSHGPHAAPAPGLLGTTPFSRIIEVITAFFVGLYLLLLVSVYFGFPRESGVFHYFGSAFMVWIPVIGVDIFVRARRGTGPSWARWLIQAIAVFVFVSCVGALAVDHLKLKPFKSHYVLTPSSRGDPAGRPENSGNLSARPGTTADQVFVEDLASQMLHGIRDKDDAKPKPLATNWPSTFTTPSGPVELKLKWAPVGERVVLAMDVRRNGEYLTPGQPDPLKEELTVGRKYGLTVLKATPGGGHEVELGFLSIRDRVTLGGKTVLDYDSTNKSSAVGPNSLVDLDGKVAGSKIRYFLNASNEVERMEGVDELEKRQSSGASADTSAFLWIPFSEGYLKQMMNGLHRCLPSKAVRPGDTWSFQMDTALGPLVATMVTGYTATFRRWEQHGKRNCARLEFQAIVETKPDPNSNPAGTSISSPEGTISGVSWFDPELGMIIETTGNNDMKMVLKKRINPSGSPGASGPTQSTIYHWHDVETSKLE